MNDCPSSIHSLSSFMNFNFATYIQNILKWHLLWIVVNRTIIRLIRNPLQHVVNQYKRRIENYKQTFRNEWLQIKAFQGWLKPPTPGNLKPMCTQCACNLTCSKTGIERHSKSAAHIRLQKSSQQQCSISDSFQKL